MKLTVLFVPGYREKLNSRDYSKLLRSIEDLGYQTGFVEIDWRYTTQDDWTEQLLKACEQYSPSTTILGGFSFGAVSALLAAFKYRPCQLWLFSLSPLFREFDDTWSKTDHKVVGKRRLDLAKKISLEGIMKDFHIKTKLFVGDEEVRRYPEMGAVVELMNEFKNVDSYSIPGVGHDATNERYIEAIIKNAACS